jgi:hypothetical protein
MRTISKQARERSAVSRERGLADLARSRFKSSTYLELRRLDCDCAGGVLTLRGRVSRFYLKQLAFCLVADLTGTVTVNNAISVRY